MPGTFSAINDNNFHMNPPNYSLPANDQSMWSMSVILDNNLARYSITKRRKPYKFRQNQQKHLPKILFEKCFKWHPSLVILLKFSNFDTFRYTLIVQCVHFVSLLYLRNGNDLPSRKSVFHKHPLAYSLDQMPN